MRMKDNSYETRDLQRKMRRSQTTLITTGLAVIIFGGWNIIKMVMLILFAPQTMHMYWEETLSVAGSYDKFYDTVFNIVNIVLLFIFFLVRFYIGRAAIAEGSGRRRSCVYIILACIMACADMLEISNIARNLDMNSQLLTNNIVTIIVDATALILLIEMIISAIKVRKMMRIAEG